MKLAATTMEYRMETESGYGFTVTATYDPERGWNASVSMSSHGHREATGAVEYLRHATEAFIKEMKAGVE